MFPDTELSPKTLEILRREPPVLFIPSLIGQRRAALTARGLPEKPAGLLDGPRPVNPSLLASAISCSAVLGFDHRSFLNRYMRGEDLPDLDELIPAPALFETDLARFVELERKYLQGIRLMPLTILPGLSESETFRRRFEAQADPTDFLQSCWDRIAAGDVPPSADFDKYDLLLRAWIIVNPRLAERYAAPRAALIEYGFRYNAPIHDERERCERRLGELDASLNVILSSPAPQDEKRRAILELKAARENAVGLVRRARRLYEWNPAEIEAHQVEDAVSKELSGKLSEKLRHYGE